MAAGTAMYDALAANMANINRFPISAVTNPLSHATAIPLIIGITIGNQVTNQPYFLKAPNFLAVTIPISNKNSAKNPLKISVVKGLIPSACLLSAIKPMHRLPKINSTLPLVTECFITSLIGMLEFFSLSYSIIKITPTIIAGDSINAITATICPP